MMNGTVKKIGSMLVFCLVILIFMSRTIYSYGIPEVTAGIPKTGKLKKEEYATGAARYQDIVEQYFELSGYVEEVYVQEGDKVAAGDPVVSFRYDREDLLSQLDKLEVEKNSIALGIEGIQMAKERINRQMGELQREDYSRDTVSRYELDKLAAQIERLSDELQQSETLFAAGAIAESQLIKQQSELADVVREYENTESKLADAEKDAQKALEEKERERQKKLADYQEELTALEQDLKAKALESENIRLQEASVNKSLLSFSDNLVFYAPAAGAVLELPVKKGQYVSQHQLLYSLGCGDDFIIECQVSAGNSFIDRGDRCSLNNTDKRFEGEVVKLEAGENSKNIWVKVRSDNITQGETFDVKFTKESGNNYTLIPNGALNKDSQGYFIYLIKKRTGILGEEYYLSKNRITIGEWDNENTVVTGGISFFEPLLEFSRKPVTENGAVKVGNEGDFFVQ